MLFFLLFLAFLDLHFSKFRLFSLTLFREYSKIYLSRVDI
nr:MAG TPA: hypothetical protein [Bacteriophage sp.]